MLKFLFYAYSPITSFTINISVIFRKVSGLQQFLTAAAVEAEFVKNLVLRLYFLSKVNLLGAPRTHTRHGSLSLTPVAAL